MVVMMCLTRALLLDGYESRLRCCGVTRLQILHQLRNGGSHRAAALRARSRREQRALLSARKKLFER